MDSPRQNRFSPRRNLFVLTCMDGRIDVMEALGLQKGDAHIVRNAGGIVTDDVIRSLMLSQRAMGTTDVQIIQHTECGMQGLDDVAMRETVRRDTGIDPPFDLGGFSDLEESVRRSMERIGASGLIPRHEGIRGYIYDLDGGVLHEVHAPQRQAGR